MLAIKLLFLISSKILLNVNNHYTDSVFIYSSIKTPIYLIYIFIIGNKTSAFSINKHSFDIVLYNDIMNSTHVLLNIINIIILWVFSLKLFSNIKLNNSNNLLNDYYLLLFVINLIYLLFNIININYYVYSIIYSNIVLFIYLYYININIRINFNIGNTIISSNIIANSYIYKYLFIFLLLRIITNYFNRLNNINICISIVFISILFLDTINFLI